MLTEGMKKLEFLIYSRDIDVVIEYLGKTGCLQVTDSVRKDLSDTHKRCLELEKRLQDASVFLGLPPTGFTLENERIPKSEDYEEAERFLAGLKTLLEREKEAVEKKLRIDTILDEVGVFRKLNLPLKDLEAVTYLSFRYGSIAYDRIGELKTVLENRAVVIDLESAGRIIAISTKKGRFALDTELKRMNFKELQIPEEAKDLPAEVFESLEKDLGEARAALAGIEEEKHRLSSSVGRRISELARIFTIGSLVEELKDHIESTDSAYRLRGWMPAGNIPRTIQDLDALTDRRIAIRTYEVSEVDDVRQGKEKVPVRLKHGKFVSSFSGIVFSYGAPLYGTIDPTPVVAFFFILLFAIMFGDVGQGSVGLIVGILLAKDKIPAFRSWNKYALVFKTVGIASMTTGFLYGSFFANEEVLVPIVRAATGLFGTPRDRFISILPSGGMDKLFMFFGFTIAVGVVINSVGLVINLYNRFRLRDFRRAIFSKTGLVGAFFFWYSVALGIRLLAGGKFGYIDVFFLSLPLVLLFWGEPIYRLAVGERPLFPEGGLTFVMEGLVEIMESVSYYFSNSVSFLRVGAFALSHAVLSLIVFQMAELVSHAPGGAFFQIVIILFGNLLIIVLEGLIVSIQVIRLQYYEFFSKFFTESGVEFKPFHFPKPLG